MLSHKITWILLAGHFEECEVAGLESLLYPQVLSVYMACLPKSAAIADAACCSGVGVDPTQLAIVGE